ncbi:MAG: LPS assembly lipoprotein LptE [Rhodothermaceae bacterium]|nr:LPS assembly lipoprotein LptE [Rhodothermaceae bacterium]
MDSFSRPGPGRPVPTGKFPEQIPTGGHAVHAGPRNLIARTVLILLLPVLLTGCVRYSFSGVSIPSDVTTIYIPFFADRSNSGLSYLSDELNEALVNRFVNQSRLRLASSAETADVVIDGTITGYSNRPFSIAGDQQADLNRVEITVRASYKYTSEEQPVWDKGFNGNFEYDPNVDPIEGEREAALQALSRIAGNMFNDALGQW